MPVTAPVGNRLASSASMYALTCTTPRLTNTGTKLRPTVADVMRRQVERDAKVWRDAQDDRQLNGELQGAAHDRSPRRAGPPGAAAPMPAPNTSSVAIIAAFHITGAAYDSRTCGGC